jgi:hypothetical protein
VTARVVVRLGGIVAALLTVAGCGGNDEEFDRFNGDDSVTVRVTASTDLGDPVSTDLTSTTGAVIIGTGSVVPGSGPVGTDHQITVVLDDAYSDEVVKALVRADAGDRGVEDHDLVQDSANHGIWAGTLTSLGAEGEERSDTFTFELFSAAPDSDTNGILP